MPYLRNRRSYALFSLILTVAVVSLINWQPAWSHPSGGGCFVEFATPTTFAVGPQPYSVAVGDFNGDGIRDIATANRQTNNPLDPRGVSVLLGTGTGSFGVARHFAVGRHLPPSIFSNPEPPSIAAADFNHDGKSDIVTANRNSDDVSVLLSLGGGDFQDSQQFSVGVWPVSVAVGDFDGDGNSDLATANNSGPGVSVLRGNGAGSFGPATSISFGIASNYIAAGDFDGDGNDDLAVTGGAAGNLAILISTGSSSFAATNYSVGGQPLFVTVGDFNSDGQEDLAVAQFSGGVSILLGTGTGSFGTATNFSTLSAPVSIAVGDFGGDSKLDLATVDGTDFGLTILLGTGTGAFGPATRFAVPPGSSPRFIASGDFNRDGGSDLVTANSQSNTVSVRLNSCVSADTTPPVLTVPSTITVTATSPAGAVVTYSVTATDNRDPNPIVSCIPQSGSTFAIGSTNVNCTATDASNNSASDSFTVNVSEASPTPTPTPIPLPTLQRAVATGAIVVDPQHLPVDEAELRANPSNLLYKFVPFQVEPDPPRSTMGIIKKSRNGWVRLWADWPTLQPALGSTFPNCRQGVPFADIENNARTRPFIRSLDEQIVAARQAGLRVILTAYRFPRWANGTQPCEIPARPQPELELLAATPLGDWEFRVPDHLGETSDWSNWINFLVARYGYSTVTRDTRRYVDFLEVCNEPNQQIWPQRDSRRALLIDNRVAQMFITAQKKVRERDGAPEVAAVLDAEHSTTLKLAGPATVDTSENSNKKTDYQTFTKELLKRLKGRFIADKNFAWTQHNYGDVEHKRHCSSSTRCRIADLNAAAWVRRRLVSGVDGYSWTGWPNGDNNPYILLTEGGARLNIAYKQYQKDHPGFKITREHPVADFEKVKQEQKRLVKLNFDRMSRGVLSPGIGLITNYLGYTDACFDSGLYDRDSPLNERELGPKCAFRKNPPEYRRFYPGITLGKPRPLYDTWSSLPPF